MTKAEYNNPLSGHATGTYPRVARQLCKYINRSPLPPKVGVTNNYEQRARNYGGEYDYLTVLYETSSLNYVRWMETELVDQYWDDLANEIRGGGGNYGLYGPYYCYVVWDE